MIDDDGVRCRNVDPTLDDGTADQQVEFSVIEVEHDTLQRPLSHLTVGDLDRCLGQQLFEIGRNPIDVLYPVVDEISLAAAAQLSQDGLAYRLITPLTDKRLYREPFCGWCGYEGKITEPTERHVQCSRNWCCGERQHVDFRTQGFEPLLVSNTEAVLLIHDDETELFELDIAA